MLGRYGTRILWDRLHWVEAGEEAVRLRCHHFIGYAWEAPSTTDNGVV
jgi:hypothetical protein